MVLNPESTYPSRRAYVIKLRREATAEALAGRLENLVTGRQSTFASAAELVACLQLALAADADPDADRSATQP